MRARAPVSTASAVGSPPHRAHEPFRQGAADAASFSRPKACRSTSNVTLSSTCVKVAPVEVESNASFGQPRASASHTNFAHTHALGDEATDQPRTSDTIDPWTPPGGPAPGPEIRDASRGIDPRRGNGSSGLSCRVNRASASFAARVPARVPRPQSIDGNDGFEGSTKKTPRRPAVSKPLIWKEIWRGWQDSNPRPLGS